MYVLDTDTLSNHLDRRRQNLTLRVRIQSEPPINLYVAIVTAEEMLKGVLPAIQRAGNTPQVMEQYALLEQLLHDLMMFNILPYDADADRVFHSLPAPVRQHHPRDSRIAAIALSRGFVVVTRNTRHYAKIPALRREDWTELPAPDDTS